MPMRLFSKITSRKPLNHEIVIVSGLPRSGTSMLMRMLEVGGIEPLTDKVRNADQDNPRGYYEFEPVKKLREGDYSWLPLAGGKSVKIISALLTYLPNNYSYHVLFTQRSIREILASQRAMLVNRGEDPDKLSDAEMATVFEKHLAQVMNWLSSQKNISTLYVDYNQLLREPAPEVMKINSFLGSFLQVEKMIAVIEPELYRQRA